MLFFLNLIFKLILHQQSLALKYRWYIVTVTFLSVNLLKSWNGFGIW